MTAYQTVKNESVKDVVSIALGLQLPGTRLALIVTAKISESRSAAASKAWSTPVNRRHSKRREWG